MEEMDKKLVVYLVWYQDARDSVPYLWGLFKNQVDAIDRAKELTTKTSGVKNPREMHLREETKKLSPLRGNSEIICAFCERGFIFTVEENTIK